MQESTRIGFIGAGNMAEAMAGALISSGKVQSRQLCLCDIRKERLSYLSTQYNVLTSDSALETFKEATTVILSVKPQGMKALLEEIHAAGLHKIMGRKQIITIAAGLPLSFYEAILYDGLTPQEAQRLPILRVMPNTPSLVLAGMSGLCGNEQTVVEDLALAETLLSAMGKVLRVKESLMDGITAVSGSGPAYIFYVVEAMVEAGMELGFSQEEATLLATTTVNGSAKLLLESEEAPAELRRRVTSPGGTTEAAIKTMMEERVGQGIQKGMLAAARRSQELSRTD